MEWEALVHALGPLFYFLRLCAGVRGVYRNKQSRTLLKEDFMPPPLEQKFCLATTMRRFHELRVVLETEWWSRQRLGDSSFQLLEPEFQELMKQVRAHAQMKLVPLSRRNLMAMPGNCTVERYVYEPDKLPVHATGYLKSGATQRYAMMLDAYDTFAPHIELLSWYYGQKMDLPLLWDLCWRLAAGQEHMKAGQRMAQAFPTVEIAEQWVGLHIDSVRYGPPTAPKQLGPRTVPGKPQLILDFRVLSGCFGGLKVTQNIPYAGVVFHLAKQLGFPVFKKTHYNELVQCVFIGKLGIVGGGQKFPRISEFFISDATRTYNAKLRRARAETCYRGYPQACHRCPVGYLGASACMNATRALAVVQQECPVCGKMSVFDPLSQAKACLACEGLLFKRLETRGE